MVKWILTHCMQSYNNHYNWDIEHFHHTKKFPYIFAVNPSTSLQPLATPLMWYVFCAFSRISYKLNSTISGPLFLAFFHLAKCFCNLSILLTDQKVFPLYCWVVFHYMNVPQFTCQKTFRLFPRWCYHE